MYLQRFNTAKEQGFKSMKRREVSLFKKPPFFAQYVHVNGRLVRSTTTPIKAGHCCSSHSKEPFCKSKRRLVVFMYRRVKSSIELKCKETISRNMLYALFVILRTLLPLNVIHLMIANLLLKTARAHISKTR